MALSITSVNSVLTLSMPDVYPVPQVMQGYAVDEAFSTEEVEPAQGIIGVDGLASFGFTPFLTKMGLTFQANSPSIAIMNGILAFMESVREVVEINGQLEVPSIGTLYTLNTGVLTGATKILAGKKVLQPGKYVITWSSTQAGPV